MVFGAAAMWKTLVADARELRRAAKFGGGARAVVKTVLQTDGYRILVLQRLREAANRHHLRAVSWALRLVQQTVDGIEIDHDATVGEGVYFVHPVGVVIGGDARIGRRVRFYGGNTIGTAKDDGYPVIGDDVYVGAGARVLGPVHVGAGARIGANAVVVTDVPAGCVAAGVPARVHPRHDLRAPKRRHRRGSHAHG